MFVSKYRNRRANSLIEYIRYKGKVSCFKLMRDDCNLNMLAANLADAGYLKVVNDNYVAVKNLPVDNESDDYIDSVVLDCIEDGENKSALLKNATFALSEKRFGQYEEIFKAAEFTENEINMLL